ncbi:hypothetical protein Kpol_262p2 [Vanderwaltozyma polyspora DSM 70294]|uniref:Peptidase S59 domain-containing protein n=1 Tax=Vanderwaltozyma polyspora (strain ATCC 22028 / DSM 70294 / BCRC 21397 / CBS 2163 / NBRC 10782 / NRRL Y-8283 / UCD 57-17) TaxID=436907 RepID=A7TT06_VANPO|nr:uncharacterized protein Kpol_262p2 [Vanderwaltozyma polyspora DSM 70294]EDO14597.1 hypothetical protein Kpol_262p2 [Vanderwaltozyma polyspora DSM 70294]
MFGASNNTFGGGGARPFGSNVSQFGKPQQASTGFGMNQTNTQSTFGAFGSNTAAGQSNTGGMTPSFGLGNTSGTMNSPFGQNVNPSNQGGLFGSNSLTSSASSNAMGGQAGTSLKPFTEYQEKDNTTGTMNHFQSITCMPEYRNFSFEELRFQDYQANRRYPNAPGTAGSQFGATTSAGGFGNMLGSNTNQPVSSGTGGLFGQNPLSKPSFGSAASANTNAGFGSSFGGNASGTANAFGGSNAPKLGMGGTTGGGLFGQSPNQQSGGSFGQTTNQASSSFNTGNAFGASNTSGGGLFGQNNQQQGGGGLFGQAQNQGQQQGGLFGQNPQQQQGGLFGQAQNQGQQQGGLFGNKPASGGGLFGQQSNTFNQNQQSGSLYGQNSQQQQGGGGLFGQAQNQGQQQGGLFGQGNQQQQGGLFGQNTQQQAGGFGAKPAGGLFGQNQQTTSFGSGSGTAQGGLFGQSTQQQGGGGLFGQAQNQGQQQGGLFGQGNQQQQGGLFGQNTQQQAGGFGAKPAGGLFGQNQQTTSFGSGPGTAQGGLFGQSTQQQTGGGLFGQGVNQGQQPQPQQQAGGLFGQSTQPQTGGLFGAKPAGSTTGGLFGANTSTQQPAATQGSGLFGAKPTGTGLFGGQTQGSTTSGASAGGLFGKSANPAPGGAGLFGNTAQSNSVSSNTGGLFGSKPAATGGLFGGQPSAPLSTFGQNPATTSLQTPGTGSLFGAKPVSTIAPNTASQMQQQTGISTTNPYGTNELFTRITIPESITAPSQPRFTKVNTDTKATSLNTAYKLNPKPLFSKGSLPSASIAHATPSIDKAPQNTDKSDNETTLVKFGSSLFNPETDEALITADELLFNPDRKSFKTLLINKKKVNEALLNEKSTSPDKDIKRITFNEKSLLKDEDSVRSSIFDNVLETPTNTENKLSEASSVDHDFNERQEVSRPDLKGDLMPNGISKLPGVKGSDFTQMENGYYISPSLDTLASMSLFQLSSVTNFVVGHKDHGYIEFMEPVNLTDIPLTLICGGIIEFRPRACIVKSGNEAGFHGKGFNVRARIVCYKCFPLDKSTRKPVTNPDHALVKNHIKKFKSMPNCKFESYDPKTGTYVFAVDNACS